MNDITKCIKCKLRDVSKIGHLFDGTEEFLCDICRAAHLASFDDLPIVLDRDSIVSRVTPRDLYEALAKGSEVMPFLNPTDTVLRHDRRSILKAFGIGLPAAIAMSAPPEAKETQELNERDIFEIHIQAAIAYLPEEWRATARCETSNVRGLMIAVAMGAVAVWKSQQDIGRTI